MDVADDSPPDETGGASPMQDKVEPNFGSVTSVKVAVRVRPLIGMESASGCQACMFGDSENNQIVAGDNRCFQFDNVFGVESTQEEVYRKTTLPLVERCLDGFNATVLAYGQTGSGKTWTVGNAYTVNGAPEDAGIIPRAVVDIFKRVDELRATGVKTSVHASFLEVLNEEIKDLVGDSAGVDGDGGGVSAAGGLPLRENLQGEVTVAGLSQHEIAGAQDLGRLLERGALCRATASTNMNTHSSRSHAICTLSFEVVRPATDDQPETVANSKFHLVDLAGSERAKKTGAEGKRLREGININKGLLALGNVISALSEGGSGSGSAGGEGAGVGAGGGGGGGHRVHVPYRDSKLTRLLQSSLGGNSHTVMIACVSPADSNMAESLNTLRYAGRAMNIKNTAVKNEGLTGPPVSYAEVMALRKEVRTLQVELLHARVSGLAGFAFGSAGGEIPRNRGDDAGAAGETVRAAVQEAAELRRVQNSLERRVLEATRHATAAVEGEMAARVDSDRWRLRCEQLSKVLREAAPEALASLPSWATGTEDDYHRKSFPEDYPERSSEGIAERLSDEGKSAHNEAVSTPRDGVHKERRAAAAAAAGSLARELRQKVFELEAQVSELQGALAETREMTSTLVRGGVCDAGADAGNGHGAVAELARLQGKTTSAAGRADDLFSSFDTDGLNNSGNGGEGGVTGGEAEGEDECEGVGEHTEELRRVDQEIENKERELLIKAEQARAYEAMKGQFEGLLGRLQGEVSSLQSERDGLLRKLAITSKEAQTRPGVRAGIGGAAGWGSEGGGGAVTMAMMKARVAELEYRIKESRKKVAEHQRAERERAAAAREAERLRVEVAEAKQRRAELQRVHREASTRFQKETRQLQLKEARMRRDGERMQWQVKKLQESQSKTQAALKRKMEEHSIAMRKVRKLETQRVKGARDGAGGVEAKYPAVKEAKRAELATWLAAEIEEASAVQRAKHALKEQLHLRSQAARKAQSLRGKQGQGLTVGAPAAATGEWEEGDGRDVSEGQDRELVTEELAELEERIASGSKVIHNLQAFLVSADRYSTATGARLPGGVGGAGNARWSRLRTPWDNKTALSLLLTEAVKAKVLGMDLAESSAVKDMELRSLSREVAGLRATAAGRAVGLSSAREAMAAAVAAAAVAVEAVGGTGDDEDGAGAGTKDEERDVEGVGRQRNESEGRHLEYDEQEQSFLLVDDSEEDEDDDEDEEWLPDANPPNKKRTSQNSASATAAAAAGNGSGGREREINGRDLLDDNRSGGDHASSGNRNSFESLDGGGSDSGKDRSPAGTGRSSSGSARSPGDNAGGFSSSYGVSKPRREVINWANLDLYTVVQLKEFLRYYRLPVSGKKDILTERLRTALNAPSPERSTESSTASVADFSFSSSTSSIANVDCGGRLLQTPSLLPQGSTSSCPDTGAGIAYTPDTEQTCLAANDDAPSYERRTLEVEDQSQLSLRARLQLRARNKHAQEVSGEKTKGEDSNDGHGLSRATERRGSSSVAPKDAPSGTGGVKEAVTAAVTLAPTRMPLGVLSGSNNVSRPNMAGRAHNNSAPGGISKPSKPKAGGPTTTTFTRASGGDSDSRAANRPLVPKSTSALVPISAGDNASLQRRPTPASSSAAGGVTGGGGVKRCRPLVGPTIGKPGRNGGGRYDSAGGSNGRSHGGMESLGAIHAKQQSKRTKLDGRGESGSSHTPSYLKPTKSTGAHANAALHSRSSAGGGGGGVGSGAGGSSSDGVENARR